jgi:tight adherence protein B
MNDDAQRWLVSGLAFAAAAALVWVVRGAYLGWRAAFTRAAKVSLEDMFVFIDPKSVFHVNVGVFLLLPVIVYLITGAPGFALAAALVGAALPRVTWAVMRSRRRARLTVQLPDGLNMMSGSLRAGASLQMALNMVVTEAPAPLCQEFSLLLREQRLGLALEDSLRGMSQRLAMEEVDLFVSALTIAKEVGGNLSEILERLAATLRQKATMEGKIRALTSQGKLQGIVVGLLPLFLAGVLYTMDPVAMLPLFTTMYGWGVMAVVFVLLVLGGFFIKKIVTIDV